VCLLVDQDHRPQARPAPKPWQGKTARSSRQQHPAEPSNTGVRKVRAVKPVRFPLAGKTRRKRAIGQALPQVAVGHQGPSRCGSRRPERRGRRDRERWPSPSLPAAEKLPISSATGDRHRIPLWALAKRPEPRVPPPWPRRPQASRVPPWLQASTPRVEGLPTEVLQQRAAGRRQTDARRAPPAAPPKRPDDRSPKQTAPPSSATKQRLGSRSELSPAQRPVFGPTPGSAALEQALPSIRAKASSQKPVCRGHPQGSAHHHGGQKPPPARRAAGAARPR